MNNSPEIENIIEQAIEFAKEKKHQYCTIEHLLLSLIKHTPFKKCLISFGIDYDMFFNELNAYVDGLQSIVTTEDPVVPRRTNSLERVMNRSVTEVDRKSVV